MFIFGLGFLVLFSVISVLLGNDDRRQSTDSRDALALWARLSAR